MTLRFLVDMPVTPKVVERLAASGHDAVHASAVGLAKAPDQVILEHARAEGRIIITADLDYPRLLALHPWGSAGLILFRGGAYSDAQMLRLLDRVLERAAELELPTSIIVVDEHRIRRRPLPAAGTSSPSG